MLPISKPVTPGWKLTQKCLKRADQRALDHLGLMLAGPYLLDFFRGGVTRGASREERGHWPSASVIGKFYVVVSRVEMLKNTPDT